MSNEKTEDLVPTMKLRWVNSDYEPRVLQQWHYDRSRPGPDGLCHEGKWIDVPFGKD